MEEVWFLLPCGVGNSEAEERALAQTHQTLEFAEGWDLGSILSKSKVLSSRVEGVPPGLVL